MYILNKSIARRRFLKASAATLTALGLGGVAPCFQRAAAGEIAPGKKVLYIFLRGGIDGMQFLMRGSERTSRTTSPRVRRSASSLRLLTR